MFDGPCPGEAWYSIVATPISTREGFLFCQSRVNLMVMPVSGVFSEPIRLAVV